MWLRLLFCLLLVLSYPLYYYKNQQINEKKSLEILANLPLPSTMKEEEILSNLPPVINVEETLGKLPLPPLESDLIIITDLLMTPLDAFGWTGGLKEARFYEPHEPTTNIREEIKEAAQLYGIDETMMFSFAKVESGFNPRNQTGSYKGLFQLSNYEFKRFGQGDIWDIRDNSRAAAHKFFVEKEMFRDAVGHSPNYSERYMIHQQGIQGAIEHYAHPTREAWKSMCATDEGKQKGEGWCKKAIWGNMMPVWKSLFSAVVAVFSGDFINLWSNRINDLASNSRKIVAPETYHPVVVAVKKPVRPKHYAKNNHHKHQKVASRK